MAGSRKFDGYSPLPTRHERKGIFVKHMHEKRDFDASYFRGGKRFMPVRIRCNQAVAIHNYPLVRISGTVVLDPLHFTPSVTGRHHSDSRFPLKAVSESQHLLLLRRRQATDRVENDFFDARASLFLIDTRASRFNGLPRR